MGKENKTIVATEVYKASKDGFSASNFYDKVDGKGNCLVLIRSENDYRFGGYRSIPFEKSDKEKYRPDP